MDKLSTYHHLFSLDKQRAYLYVIRYKPNCGHICHEFIIKQYEEQFQSASYYYEIVTSDHSVIRTSLHILQTIHKLYSNIILDYIPFIPNLKYDETIFHENYCMAESSSSSSSPSPSPSDGLTLHIIFTILKSDPNISSFIKFGIIKDDLESFSNLIQPATKQVSCTLFLSCTLLSSTSLATILDYYSHLPIVHWIEIRPEMITYTKYANSVTQIDPPGSPHPDNIYQLYRGMNLTGQDEIIGISDTGIDITSCYFYDPDNPMLYNILNPSHRKISYYRTYIDSTDSFGHGTSVAGIAAGECYYPIDNIIEKKRKEYDSVASKSKIAFFDISGTDNVLRIPSDINENLLKVLYSAGSRIISLSWGSSSNRYTIDAR